MATQDTAEQEARFAAWKKAVWEQRDRLKTLCPDHLRDHVLAYYDLAVQAEAPESACRRALIAYGLSHRD